MGENGLSVVVPIYNEREAVSRLEQRIEHIRSLTPFPLEFILVNDKSDDGTEEELAKLAADGVRVIHHRHNQGYGAALKTGILNSRYRWIAITDADETYPDQRISELFLWAYQEDCQMVVGARTGGHVRIPLLRRVPKWILGKLANFLVGYTIPDLNSGLRVMRKDAVSRFLHVLPSGFSFTSTITLAMLSNGYRVDYVPVDYYRRSGRSKIRPIYDTLNFLQLICRTVLWFNPLRVFIPVSLLLMLAAPVILYVSWKLTGRAMDVTFGVTLMTGVILLAVGMLADLIVKRTGP